MRLICLPSFIHLAGIKWHKSELPRVGQPFLRRSRRHAGWVERQTCGHRKQFIRKRVFRAQGFPNLVLQCSVLIQGAPAPILLSLFPLDQMGQVSRLKFPYFYQRVKFLGQGALLATSRSPAVRRLPSGCVDRHTVWVRVPGLSGA